MKVIYGTDYKILPLGIISFPKIGDIPANILSNWTLISVTLHDEQVDFSEKMDNFLFNDVDCRDLNITCKHETTTVETVV